jgi:hypothetical protein
MANKKTDAKRRRLSEFRKAMVKVKAKRTALKITALIFDRETPHFLIESMLVALADAGRELGVLDEWEGYGLAMKTRHERLQRIWKSSRQSVSRAGVTTN